MNAATRMRLRDGPQQQVRHEPNSIRRFGLPECGLTQPWAHSDFLSATAFNTLTLLMVSPCAGAPLAACGRGTNEQVTGGYARRGAALVANAGCGTSHTMPDVQSARGRVGPPLDHICTRTILAGVLRNRLANMMLCLEVPQTVRPARRSSGRALDGRGHCGPTSDNGRSLRAQPCKAARGPRRVDIHSRHHAMDASNVLRADLR